MKWARPRNVTKVRILFGLAVCYGRFVEGFLRIVAPQSRLTQKNKKLEWTEECERSFLELSRLTAVPILIFPTSTCGFVVFSDASRKCLGCVLMQKVKLCPMTTANIKLIRLHC